MSAPEVKVGIEFKEGEAVISGAILERRVLGANLGASLDKPIKDSTKIGEGTRS